MGEKLIIGPGINKGFTNNRTAFNIDNDAFPFLMNAYQWRGRIKRKRGTEFLSRLTRYFASASTAYGSVTSFNLVAGDGNLLTGFSLQANGSIVPGSVSFVGTTGPQTYTDNSLGVLTGSSGGTGTINYATGAITITGGTTDTINTASFKYYPTLPAMGIEDVATSDNSFPGTLEFDTKYAYNQQSVVPYTTSSVSFYNNPVTGAYPSYVQKTTWTPTSWNGQDYQQFWTTNYQGALWATNGITTPFNTTNIGMQYKTITVVDTITTGPPSVARLHIAAHGLVRGDFVFVNEVATTTGINFQTGYVISADPQDPNFVDVEFPNATIATAGTGGIAQYLTNRSDITKDGIRWYNGDPTNDASPPTFQTGKGWVNFAPPISESTFSIADEPARQYYLVGARMILSFKDRLLFLGPVVQTSTAGSQVYLQDTIIYSQNGTPYYTASFTGSPTAATTVFHEILVPDGQTATASAYFDDSAGFGGFVTAGLDQPIITVSPNEDVLMLGFNPNYQVRFVYTGNDIIPFNFYIVNSELGSSSTFSSVTLDKGVISRGPRGFVISSQVDVSRFDLDIPDEVFEISLLNNGNERFCAQRDFINEWIYFTYPANYTTYKFPNQTLQYNYRDNSWGVFRECYTTYGSFRRQTGYTWATIGMKFATWDDWGEPWEAGGSTLLQPEVLGGNQQGFIIVRDAGTGEGTSLAVQAINLSTNIVTSPNHCLNSGDYITFSGVIGNLGDSLNGKVFSVGLVTTDTFLLNPPSLNTSLDPYIGGGLITRYYVPFIQTKQFPLAWDMACKTRLGPQQYLLSSTASAQMTLLIYLSQNSSQPWNDGPIVPSTSSENDGLIYSTLLYTCPESTNLGLTPANTNLQQLTTISSAGGSANNQAQIWHRVNTSLIGDTVQLGFTLNDEQMRDPNRIYQTAEVELHTIIMDVSKSSVLA